MNEEDKERLVKLLGQNKLTKAGSFSLHTYIRDLEDCNKEKDKEIERLENELSIKTTYIEDVLKTILKSDDFKMQREVYEHGIEYDKKLKALKEGK